MAPTSSSPETSQPNWLHLPPELTAAILHRLGAFEILNTALKVCSTWRKVCRDPSMWKSINISDIYAVVGWFDMQAMCRYAVDLSCGLLEEIRVDHFCTQQLFHYIADRSPHLRSLRVAYCYDIRREGLGEVAKKLPELEELHLFFIKMPTEALESFGRFCPKLKSFTYNLQGSRVSYTNVDDKEAQAIAKTMSGLRHLSLFGNQMTNDGLQAILNGCPHLESLDMRQCFNVDLSGDLGSLCAQRIKTLKRPNDSIAGYEFDASVDDGYGDSSYDDEYPSAFSDIDLSDVADDYEFSDGLGPLDSDMSDDSNGIFD